MGGFIRSIGSWWDGQGGGGGGLWKRVVRWEGCRGIKIAWSHSGQERNNAAPGAGVSS